MKEEKGIHASARVGRPSKGNPFRPLLPTVSLAVNLAAARGRVHLFGLYPEAAMSPLTLLRAGVTLAGDVATLPRYFLMAIRWVEYRKVLAEPMVSGRFSLDQAKEAFDAFSKGDTVKVLFEM